MIHTGVVTTPSLDATTGAPFLKTKQGRKAMKVVMAPAARSAGELGDSKEATEPSRSRQANKSARRRARAKVRATKDGRTALEDAAVTPASRRRYAAAWESVQHLVCRSRSALRSFSVIDANLAKHLLDMYLDGEDLSAAQYLVAAVLFFCPLVKAAGMLRLPRVRQSLQGWRRLAPPQSRLPIPFEAVALLATWGFLNNYVSAALHMLLNFMLYLRPTEGLHLRCQDLVRPPARHRRYRRWTVVLHPLELGRSSKTNEYDETLELDMDYHDQVGDAIARVQKVDSRGPEEPLFTHSLRDLHRLLEHGSAALGLQPLGPLHPYRLRHGGASHDFSLGLRDLAGVQLRGRWRSQASVRRYQKGGRLAQLFARLPAEVQRQATEAANRLGSRCAALR